MNSLKFKKSSTEHPRPPRSPVLQRMEIFTYLPAGNPYYHALGIGLVIYFGRIYLRLNRYVCSSSGTNSSLTLLLDCRLPRHCGPTYLISPSSILGCFLNFDIPYVIASTPRLWLTGYFGSNFSLIESEKPTNANAFIRALDSWFPKFQSDIVQVV